MAKWKYKTGKVRGAYGQVDFKKKTVTVDKARHRKSTAKRITPNKDGSENLFVTAYHELMHVAHPKWTEKQVEEKAKKARKTLSTKQKARIYAKFQ